MFCRQCGASMPEDAAFCSKCGKVVTEQPAVRAGGSLAAAPSSHILPAQDAPVALQPKGGSGVVRVLAMGFGLFLAVTLVAWLVSLLANGATTTPVVAPPGVTPEQVVAVQACLNAVPSQMGSVGYVLPSVADVVRPPNLAVKEQTGTYLISALFDWTIRNGPQAGQRGKSWFNCRALVSKDGRTATVQQIFVPGFPLPCPAC